MSRAAAMTRQAISPRLAIRIFRNTLFLLPRRLHAHRLELLYPGGLSLFKERSNTFLALGRDADFGDAFRRVGNCRVVRSVGGNAADQVFDLGLRRSPTDDEVAEKRVHRAVEFFLRRDIRQ